MMEEASKFMDEEIPLAIETAERELPEYRLGFRPSTLIKARRSLHDQAWAGVACSRHQNRPCCCRTCAI